MDETPLDKPPHSKFKIISISLLAGGTIATLTGAIVIGVGQTQQSRSTIEDVTIPITTETITTAAATTTPAVTTTSTTETTTTAAAVTIGPTAPISSDCFQVSKFTTFCSGDTFKLHHYLWTERNGVQSFLQAAEPKELDGFGEIQTLEIGTAQSDSGNRQLLRLEARSETPVDLTWNLYISNGFLAESPDYLNKISPFVVLDKDRNDPIPVKLDFKSDGSVDIVHGNTGQALELDTLFGTWLPHFIDKTTDTGLWYLIPQTLVPRAGTVQNASSSNKAPIIVGAILCGLGIAALIIGAILLKKSNTQVPQENGN
mmetsp:Transcript_14756/g.28569  ORF Transcript_14756/g.28569 Transcript_14756/m.28569 type:complete len:315 (-) Transcript_14756:63-1007(-)